MSQRKPAAMTPSRKVSAPAAAMTTGTDAQRKAMENPVIAKILARKAFFESAEFNRLVNVFAGVVRKEDIIDQDVVAYAKPDRFPFSGDELRNVVEAVMEHAPEETRETKTNGDFVRLSKTYRDIDFTVLIGPPSIYQLFAGGKGPKP